LDYGPTEKINSFKYEMSKT